MTMPTSWGAGGLGEFAGVVRFRRRFGYPSRIDPHETVWITFAGVEGQTEVSLNGRSLPRDPAEPFEFEVTPLLQPRNELIVDLTGHGGRCGLCGEVALEIRCRAFLRDVRVEIVPGDPLRLAVAGLVVGAADGPLELYVLVGGQTVFYAPVETRPDGWPFDGVSDPIPELETPDGAPEIRVDLVQGGIIWYTLVRPFPGQQK
jgi:hypothetical protein